MKRLLVLVAALALATLVGASALAQPTQITVEGQGDYFVTGESYPISIQVAGYNSRDGAYYLTFTLRTTKAVGPAETATFKYFIEVFDGSGNLMGNLGSPAVPQETAAAVGTDQITVPNALISVSSLPAAYRVVITVKAVDIS